MFWLLRTAGTRETASCGRRYCLAGRLVRGRKPNRYKPATPPITTASELSHEQALMSLSARIRVCTRPVAASQIRTVLSRLPVASQRPSGATASI